MNRKLPAAIISAALLTTCAATALTTGTGNASGTRLQTVSQYETIVSSHCYTTHRVTTTYYGWSSTRGWLHYPSPKVTVTNSETCH